MLLRPFAASGVALAALSSCLLAVWRGGSLFAPAAIPQAKRTVAFPSVAVNLPPGALPVGTKGRLFLAVSRSGGPEPRAGIGDAQARNTLVLARDAVVTAGNALGVLDGAETAFPLEGVASLSPGAWRVQAVFAHNRDLWLPDAPGNRYSDAVPVQLALEGSPAPTITLALTNQTAPDTPPADTADVKFLKFKSEKLSAFWKRPMFLRAGVILPKGWADTPAARYPLRVHIGGYGTRYTAAQDMMRSDFRRAWDAPDGPRMVVLHLDGAGPLGDPYQVNSANHGPYGDAVTQELIPYVEKTFRCVGRPEARFTDGGSTGGWVSLALQVFYPGFFNGCWSGYPDPVDFRAYETINIYEDANAYKDAQGSERPSMRGLDGRTLLTMRQECGSENVLGPGDTYATSGGQWGAWNATYSTRSAEGLPVPLWNPRTGEINQALLSHWQQYDLRRRLESDWATLGPKLRGKLHIWVGDADEYFLDRAVRLLDDFLKKANPPADARIAYGAGRGHGWEPYSERQKMDEMITAWKQAAQK